MRFAAVIVPSIAKSSQSTRRMSPLGDLFAERLSEPDAAFRVEVLEARGRVGERLTRAIEQRDAERGPILVVISGEVRLDDDGAPVLAVAGDKEGFALAELRPLLAAATDDALVIVDAAHVADPEDPTALAGVVAATRDALEPKESGIGLLMGARTLEKDQSATSPFVRAFLDALDRARPVLKKQGRAGLGAVYDAMRADLGHFHEIAAGGHFRGRTEFPLLIQPSIVIGASDSTAPRSSARPPATRSVPPSLIPENASPAVEEAWRAGSKLSRDGKHPEAIEQYKKALLLLGGKAERAELYYRIAQAKEALGSAGEAVHNYDKALGVEPLHRYAFDRAAALLREQKDFARLERLMRRRLEAQGDAPAKSRELGQIAALWLDEAKDAAKALPALEQWVALGEDPDALEKLALALGSIGRHAAANDARKRLAKALTDHPARRARTLVEAAKVAREHLPGGGDAIDLAKQALEADPTALEALEVAASELGARRRWVELAELYEHLVERVLDPIVAWDLGKKLGMLYRDELDDAEGAKRAFARAVGKNPEDVELRFWLAELHEAERDYGRAAAEMRAAANVAPERADVFRRALWCFEKTGEADSAWNAACILDHLAEADINESLLADQHRPDGLIAARGSLGDAEWALLRPERDEPLERLLKVVADAAIALRVADLEKRGQLPKLDPSTLQNPGGTTTLVRSLAWSSRLLGVAPPALHVLPSVDGELSPLPLLEPTAAAARALGSGLELSELAFLWARALTYFRPEHRILIFYPTFADVAKLLLATLALAGVDEADSEIAPIVEALEQELADERRDELTSVAEELSHRRLRSRVAHFVRSVHAAASRAGLVAAGDVARAINLAKRFPLRSDDDAGREVTDLSAYAISAEYASLRDRIGVGVKS